jgi:hypothetical protein
MMSITGFFDESLIPAAGGLGQGGNYFWRLGALLLILSLVGCKVSAGQEDRGLECFSPGRLLWLFDGS